MLYHSPFERIDPQNFRSLNRGDLYAPAGFMAAPLEIGRALTSGFIGHNMPVTPVPNFHDLPNGAVKAGVQGGRRTPVSRIGG